MAALTQKTAFADDFTTLADKPNKTAAEMKALFESQPGELLTYINDTQIKEITEGTYNFAASAVGTDAYAVTIANVAALTAGLELFVLADVANTGAATCQVNALTAKAIRKNGVVVLEDGDIPAGGVAHLKYDGTNYQLLNPVKTTAVSNHLAETMTQMYTVTTGFAEGWSGTICYGKTNADILIVSIDTLTKTSDIGSNDTVYTLPAGYRPAIFAKTNAAGINAGVAVVNGSMVEIMILTTGALRLRNVGGVTATVVSAQGAIIVCPM